MKIVILYGVGEVGKRNELLKIKKNFSPDAVSEIDFKERDLKDLQTLILSTPLFSSGKRLIVVENAPSVLDLEKFSSSDNELYLAVVAGQLKSDTILLKSAHKIEAKVVSFEGEEEVSVFPFLDKLIEKKKEAFKELEKLFEDYNGIYMLAMVYYLLRRNILPLPASSFARKKIEQQKIKFQFTDWADFYKIALETEFKIKSGLISEKLGLTLLTQCFMAR